MTPARPLELQSLSDKTVTVLLVSPAKGDHAALRRIFSRSNWILYTAESLKQAWEILRRHSIPVIVADSELPDGTWGDLLQGPAPSAAPPKIIVTHRFSDRRNFAGWMSDGAYDVLPKPFEAGEVSQSVGFAWLQWKRECVPARPAVSAAKIFPSRARRTA
jgi:DNA-binding NtrC family response regulator